MLVRIATASVLIAVLLAWLFVADYPLFAMGALGLYALSAWELGPLLGYHKRLPFLCVAVFASSLCFIIAEPGHFVDQEIPRFVKWLITAGALVWLFLLRPLVRYPRSRAWHAHLALTTVVGLLMLVPYLEGLLVLRSTNFMQNPTEGAYLVLAVMGLVVCADSGAYFVGRALGRRKLLKQVSPNKTVEGLLGGIVCACLGAALFIHLGWFSIYGDPPVVCLSCVGLTIIFSVIGDLVESMLKRICGVKDSGTLLPGHGGMLDRIDAQLAAVPVFLAAGWVLGGNLI